MIVAVALAWLAGCALQLQQAELWAQGVYLAQGLAAALVLAVSAWRAGRHGGGLALLLAACVATGALAWAQAGLRGGARVALTLPAALEGRDLIVSGRIIRLPQVDAEGLHFLFAPDAARSADNQAVTLPPRLWLAWPRDGAGPPPRVLAGERWQLPLRLKRPHGVLNPEGFDAELWLFEQGIGAVGSVRAAAPTDPQRLDHPRWWRPDEQLDAARQRWRDAALLQGGGPDVAGVLAALTVGDQSAIDSPGWALFRQTGVAHLMSISGLHITLFAWLAGGLIGRLWRQSHHLMLAWPTPYAARWGGVLLATGYALVAGWGVPAQRTVWMLALTVGLQQLGLHWPPLLVCLLAGAAVVALDPWALLQPGFWLSFVAVALLIASHPPQVEAGPSPSRREQVIALLRSALRQQIVATLALAPLTLLLFQQISLIGFVANLVAVPWITLVVTPLALAGLVLPPLWWLAGWALQPLLTVLGWLGQVPMAVWTVPAAPAWAAALGLLGGALLVLPLPWRARLAGLPLLLPLLWPAIQRPAPGHFELLAADVGQGSAILVRTATHLMLHDTGPRYGQDNDAGQRVLLPLLRARGETRIDSLVVSHRDTDHVGGAPAILAALPVGELRTGLEPNHPLRESTGPGDRPVPHVDCEAGQTWQWDGVRFEVLHPPAHTWQHGLKPNAMSCVVRVQDASGHSVLLTGDIETEQEKALVERLGPRLKSDILLVPHHGSQTSSTAAFLAAVQPKVAVAQVGYRSRFGHPHPAVLARYAAAGIPVVRTDHCGAWIQQDAGAWCTRFVRRRYWHWQAPALSPAGGAVVASP
ncbi:MAG TPA: DNA internalization-related competence protein ComEC/Rec2 [Ideonella sp.]|uniref:DNA internalization-related competence protein ComEC/Rec2 n=1 Tax=Ideonella sp. TaxID=1929293 RepID=UPI002E36E908|nr:DNA internalization-related competence protein ComEC/Rec2 [Ideonella sp.]HEX5685230.1 DNA internalization-related competence protein ComEC/Rec2 [Ideonella sp.]